MRGCNGHRVGLRNHPERRKELYCGDGHRIGNARLPRRCGGRITLNEIVRAPSDGRADEAAVRCHASIGLCSVALHPPGAERLRSPRPPPAPDAAPSSGAARSGADRSCPRPSRARRRATRRCAGRPAASTPFVPTSRRAPRARVWTHCAVPRSMADLRLREAGRRFHGGDAVGESASAERISGD